MNKYKIIFACITVLVLKNVYSQQVIPMNGLFDFKTYTVQDGLGQSTIEYVKQDSKGFIWTCTRGGVSKFDGVKFENYNTSNGLADNSGSSIAEAPDGKIWISTYKGISVYDGKIIKNYTKKDSLLHEQVWRVLFDKKGDLYIATSKGINILRKGSSKIEKYLEVGNKDANFNCIRSIYIAKNGVLYFGTNNNLCKYINGKIEVIGGYGMTFDFIEDNDGTIWFCTWGGELHAYKDNKIVQSCNVGSPINSIEKDSDENIWIATWDRGIMKFDRKNFYNYTLTNGLAMNSVWGMGVDSENNVWCGTWGSGLCVLKNQAFTLYNDKNGMFANTLGQIAIAPDNNFWISSTSGIIKFDPKTSSVKNFTEKDGISTGRIVGVVVQKDGLVTASKYGGPNLIQIKDDKILPEVIKGAGLSIYLDKNDTIWTGGDGGGISKYIKDKQKGYSTGEAHSENRIIGFYEDSKSNFWVIPYNGGLTIMNDGKPTVFNEKNGFNHEQVYGIMEDGMGALWVATGLKLYRANYKNNKLILLDSISSNDYFNGQNFGCIFYEKETNILWITTTTGAYKFYLYDYYNKHKVKTKYYYKENGFLGGECSSIIRTADSKIWFATGLGLVCYNPADDKVNPVAPFVNFIGMKLFLKNPDWGELGVSEFKNNMPLNLNLDYDQNHITFLFQGISHKAPLLVKYKYKLEGLDKGWSPELKTNEISYSNLAPGKYEFKVMASNPEGIWSKAISYEFTIRPAFWQTWWFRILTVCCLLFAVYLVFKWRTKKLNYANKLLETKVNQRTQQLKITNDELEEKNKDITDSLNYAKQIQKTILPAEEIFKSYVSEFFITYQPRDIVSGDFYWVNKIDDKIIFAVADCTGHGVPGAMVSLVCSNALNKVINELGFIKPNEILDAVSEIVEKTFKSEHGNLKDGMDISLISIDINTKKLIYAGANNPILMKGLFNLKEENGKINKLQQDLVELRADKQPIGVFAERKKFTSVELTIPTPCSIYLFSDGFADQFGGPKGKKFKYTNLQNLIYEVSNESMQIQKTRIESTFNNWKTWSHDGVVKEIEQLDDICIIGIKLN